MFFFSRRYEIVHIAANIQRDKYDSNCIWLWYGFVFEISRIRNYRKSTDFVIKRFLCRIYLPCISFCCKENFIELKLLRMLLYSKYSLLWFCFYVLHQHSVHCIRFEHLNGVKTFQSARSLNFVCVSQDDDHALRIFLHLISDLNFIGPKLIRTNSNAWAQHCLHSCSLSWFQIKYRIFDRMWFAMES